MSNYQFISYEKTPEDNLQLGIVTIMAFGKIQLKFKHMNKKDGSGTYFASASIPKTFNFQKQYEDCIVIDSRIENSDLMDYLRKSISKANHSQALSPSAFEYPKPSQPANPSVFDPNEKLPF